MLLNCGVEEDFELWCWTARRSNQPILKEISPEYSLEDWCWSWYSNTLATWCEELIHWKRHWCWERLMAGGDVDDRWLDGWMAPPTWWIWVWASSGSWWWTGKQACCSPWGRKELNMIEWLNWTDSSVKWGDLGLTPDLVSAILFVWMLLLLLSCFSPIWLCAAPETAAHQAPLSLGFSRQEHWSGLPFVRIVSTNVRVGP